MKKIVIGGQIEKQMIADLVKGLVGDKATVDIKGDIEAAMAIKSGEADYYFGACNTGGGGALAMAIALAGADKCCTVSMPGNIKSKEEILSEISNGKIAFGFIPNDAETVVPIIINELFN